MPEADRIEQQGQSAEIRRLKMELKRVTEERDPYPDYYGYYCAHRLSGRRPTSADFVSS